LPLSIGDFTDFSCSLNHVLNASEAVFGKREAPPGFHHFPVGYTARTSSIVVSGTSITRPKGQFRDSDGSVVYGPTRKLDHELELAAVIGKPSRLGESVKVGDVEEYIFGLVLLNDWSGMSSFLFSEKYSH
jgi:fumarylacetoacetase